jgi:putative DNA methylase
VLFASLVDDPNSDTMFAGDEDLAASKRAELFNLIEELVQWENVNSSRVINKARAEIARCIASRAIESGELRKDQPFEVSPSLGSKAQASKSKKEYTPYDIKHMLASPKAVNDFLLKHGPPVLDPFCGGGSIPLEAQRLGLRSYASDLNPVAVLITKALIEIPPKFADIPPVNPECQRKSKEERAASVWQDAQGLAEDVRYYGNWMHDEAKRRIGRLYPEVKVTREMAKDQPSLKEYVGEDLTVIGWLWARTVRCPNPGCRARMPLVRSFWLSKKKGDQCYANPIVDRNAKTVRFEVAASGQPPKYTTDRTGARCLFCDTFIKKPQLREIATEHGVHEIPMAIVAEGAKKRMYLAGDVIPLPKINTPDVTFLEQLITNDRRWFSPPLYGMPQFKNLFTPRQLLTLTTFSDLVGEARQRVLHDAQSGSHMPLDDRPLVDGGIGPAAYADALATYLAFGVSRQANYSTTLNTWAGDFIVQTFGRQALPMVWDYCEGNPFSNSTGNWLGAIEWIARCLEKAVPACGHGVVKQLDATQAVNGVSSPLISTDPPYYDNIGYADLSDFFYIWLRRSLAEVYPQLFATMLTPKAQELIASRHRHHGSKEEAEKFFEEGLSRAFARMHAVHQPDYPLTIYYGFKQAETDEGGDQDEGIIATASTGWETMLEGVKRAGFSITGTWPMRTERYQGLKSGTNALASSIILVCRPCPGDAPLATRKDFIAALRKELPEGLRNLQHGNIAPVDLAQAAIGPGMAVFTRYSKVMETNGSPMTVRTALGIINQALDEVLAEQEGEFDADTRWALAWFEQFGMEEGPFGVAETLSKAKNTSVAGLVEAGFLHSRGGKVRLLRREELDSDWDPATDKRLTVWEIAQHLIRTQQQAGEVVAAALMHKLGGMAETARDLAYRLYIICERKKWADEALSYNGLVIAWSELTKLALAERSKIPEKQKKMF